MFLTYSFDQDVEPRDQILQNTTKKIVDMWKHPYIHNQQKRGLNNCHQFDKHQWATWVTSGQMDI